MTETQRILENMDYNLKLILVEYFHKGNEKIVERFYHIHENQDASILIGLREMTNTEEEKEFVTSFFNDYNGWDTARLVKAMHGLFDYEDKN